jgi:hypothetical protein
VLLGWRNECRKIKMMADGMQQRSGASDMAEPNVGNVERVVSSLMGVRMLLDGLYRPSLLRMIVGSALLCRGVTGHSALYRALGLDTRKGLDAIAGTDGPVTRPRRTTAQTPEAPAFTEGPTPGSQTPVA